MPKKMQENINVEEEELTLIDLWKCCKVRWKWFAVSVVVALGLSVLYALCMTPQFMRKAEVQIKDDEGGGALGGGLDKAFGGMSLLGNSSDVQNEIIAFESPALMQQVVKELDLDVTYARKGFFRDDVLYGTNQPYIVRFAAEKDPVFGTFEMTVDEQGKLTLTDFEWKVEKDEYESSEKISAVLQAAVKTPIGVLTVVKNPRYEPSDEPMGTLIVTHRSPYGALEYFKQEVGVSLHDKLADVIDLSCKDASTQRATDILSTLIATYNKNWVADKNKMAESTDRFIAERLIDLQKDLGAVDDDISDYRSKHLLVDMQGMATLHLQANAKNNEEVMQLNSSLFMAKNMRRYLTDEAKAYEILPMNTGAGTPALEAQIAKYNEVLLDRNQLVANSSKQNPIVKEMDRNLRVMRKGILESVKGQIKTLQSHIELLTKNEAQNNQRLAQGPKQAKYLLSVERNRKVQEALYIYLLQKREETKLSQAFTAYNTRIITPPMGGTIPVTNKLVILFLGLLLGLALPALYIYLKEMLTTTVRGRKDVENLSIPLLAEIPFFNPTRQFWKKKKLEEKRVLVEQDNRNVINEAFRVLRTNLEFMMRTDSRKNVFLATSFNPESGKSFLMMNLAIALAIQNKRVLVIDADMRHASLSMYVRSPKMGLSSYLAGYASNLEELAVQYEQYDTLHVLPVGTLPPNPTELLQDGPLGELIAEVRESYDYVFIDCPPVEIVADTQIVNRYVDRSLFVVRAGVMERSMLSALEAMYDKHELNGMSMILNGTDMVGNRHSYHYGYHNNYHQK